MIPPFLSPRVCAAILAAGLLAMLPATTKGQLWLFFGEPDEEATVEVEGTLDLPDGLDPRNYIVVNQFSRDTPSGDGSFTVLARAIGPTVTAAVPNTAAEGDANPFVGVFILSETDLDAKGTGEPLTKASGGSQGEFVIDARSTAKSTVLANPFLVSRNPLKMWLLEETLEDLPELDAVEALVELVFPNNAEPFTDPDLVDAVELLYQAVEDGLPPVPPHPFPETLESAEKAISGARVIHLPRDTFKLDDKQDSQELPVAFSQLDRMRQIDYSRGAWDTGADGWELEVKHTELVPLDGIAILRKLDPANRYEYTMGERTGQLRSIEQARRLRSFASEFPFFSGERDDEGDWRHLPAMSMFRYVNIIGAVVRMAVGLVGDEIFGDITEGEIPILEADDGVYVLRSFTGKLFDGLQDLPGEAVFSWDQFYDEQVWALGLNVSAGVLDAIDIIVGMRISACRQPVLNLTKTFVRDIINLIGPSLAQGDVNVQFALMSITRNFITSAVGSYVSCLADRPLETLGRFVGSLLTLEQFTRRIGGIGQVSERLTALFNLPLGGPIGVYATPMDTVVVVVGDPFSPVIEEVEFEDWQGTQRTIDPSSELEGEPHGIMAMSEMTIRGRRFQPQGDEKPRLFVYDINNEPVQVHFDDVQDLTSEDFPLQEITFDLPRQSRGPIRIELRRAESRQRVRTPEIAEIVPIITDISHDQTFAYRGPGHGTTTLLFKTVRVGGIGFVPEVHRPMLSDTVYTLQGTASERENLYFLPMQVDSGFPNVTEPGIHEVRIRWRDGDDPVSADPPMELLVFGDPVIETASPESISPRGAVTLTGRNFGTQIFREQIAVTARFYERGGGSSIGSAPIRLIDTQPTSPQNGDQLARMLITNVPHVSEDTEAEVVIETPMGESNRFEVTLLEHPDWLYSRTIRNYYDDASTISSAQALSWANQDPAPEGTRQWFLDCSGPSGTCPDSSPRFVSVARDDVPDSNSPLYHTDEGRLVTIPPGRDAATLNAPSGTCSTCDPGHQGSHSSRSGPNSWVGLPSFEIHDTVDLSGDIHGSFSGTNANIRSRRFPSGDPVDNRITGGGLFIQNASHTTVFLEPDILDANTLVTISNSYDVEVELDIPENVQGSANVAVFVENSSNVTVRGTIRNAGTGVRVVNSEDVHLFATVYPTGEDGVGYDLRGGESYRLNANIFGSQKTSEGPIGVHLTNGNRGSRVEANIHGCHIGLLLGQVHAATVRQSRLGGHHSIPNLTGFDLGNTIGMKVEPETTGTTVRGSTFRANDIGLHIQGGTDNIYLNLGFGADVANPDWFNRIGMKIEGVGHSYARNYFDGLSAPLNLETGILVEGLEEKVLLRRTTAGPGIGETNIPSSYEASVLVRNSRDFEMSDVEVRGGPLSILIEDSEDIYIEDLDSRGPSEAGIKAERSHGISIVAARIDGRADPQSFDNFTPRGLHFIGCSNIQVSDLNVTSFTEAGIDMEQPPTESRGVSRLIGQVIPPGQTAPAEPDPRESIYEPMNRPPHNQYVPSRALRVHSTEGHGIVIRDGASGIHVAGATLTTLEGHSVYLNDPGPNIFLEASLLRVVSGQAGNPAAEGFDAVRVEDATAGNVHIGGPEAGNVFGRKAGAGVHIRNSEDVTVRANFIGTSDSGFGAQPNDMGGVRVYRSGDIIIGGPNPPDGNLISGNGSHGIIVEVDEEENPAPVHIEGNFIGTDSNGTGSLPNQGYGIALRPADSANGNGESPIPATAWIVDNVISGNEEGGILILDIDGSKGGLVDLHRNVIGRAFPPDVFGVFIGVEESPGTGVTLISSRGVVSDENRIGHHDGDGVMLIGSSRNVITDSGIFDHGGAGIRFLAASDENRVDINEISNNTEGAVRIESASVQNTLSANVLHGNEGDPIVLEEGGNAMLPAPIICEVSHREQPDGSLWFFAEGKVSEFVPSGSRIELFHASSGQADSFIIHTETEEHEWFSYIAEVDVPPGMEIPQLLISATVTDFQGNTSPLFVFDPEDIHPACLDEVPPPPPPPPGPPTTDPDDPNFAAYRVAVAFERDEELYLVNLSTGVETPIDTSEAERESYHRPSLTREPGADKLIAFEGRDADGNSGIFVMDLDNGNNAPLNVSDSEADDIEPALSPDGARVAFASDRGGSFDIYVVDADGENLTPVIQDGHNNRRPDWNTDAGGRKLVFVSDRDGNDALYIYDFTADDITPLDPGFDGWSLDEPAWGKIEDRIAFQATRASDGRETVGWYNLSLEHGFLLPSAGRELRQPDWVLAGPGRTRLIYTAQSSEEDDPVLEMSLPYGMPLWWVTLDEGLHPSAGPAQPVSPFP